MEMIEHIMNNIFLGAKTTKCYKVIKNTEHIPQLLTVLSSDDTSLDIKLNLLHALYNNFNEICFNMEIVLQFKDQRCGLCLLRILVLLFINGVNDVTCNETFHNAIIKLLQLIASHVEVKRDVIKYINNYIKDSATSVSVMKRCLKLLTVLYGYNVDKNCINSTNSINSDVRGNQPENYFYFSGEAEIEIVNDNKTADIMTYCYTQSFDVAMWFKLGLEALDLKAIFNKTTCTLLRVEFCNEIVIYFNIDMNNQLTVSIPECDVYTPICALNAKEWFNIIFKFKSNEQQQIQFTLFVNGKECNVDINADAFQVQQSDINSLSLFKNFIGVCSCVMLYNSETWRTPPLFLYDNNNNNKQRLPYGIYNEHITSKMTRSVISTNNNDDECNYLHLLSQSLVALYMPTRSTTAPNGAVVLIDTINGMNAVLKSKKPILNGVHVYTSMYDSLPYIGGVSTFLPVIESMCVNNVNDEQCFAMFMWIVLCVLDGNSVDNVRSAIDDEFVYVLSMFMEKLPCEMYTKQIAVYVKTIACNFCNNSEYDIIRQQFYKYVLFNIAIVSKFEYKEQFVLWDFVYKMYSSKQIRDDIDVNVLCTILLSYDKEKYVTYCCSEHKSYFKDVDDKVNVKEPSLMQCLMHLSGLVEIVLNQCNSSDDVNKENVLMMYRLLTKEVSPCFQNMIIKVYKEYYSKLNITTCNDTNNSNNIISTPIPIPLHNDVIEEIMDISLFVLSSSLHDVRTEVVSFIYVLTSYCELTPKQKGFIYNNIVPLYLAIDDINSSNNSNSSDSAINTVHQQQQHQRMNVSFLGDNYTLVSLPHGKQFVSKWYEYKTITPLGYKLFMELKQLIDIPHLIDLALNCLLKIQYNSELNLLLIYIRLISNQIDIELLKDANTNNHSFIESLTNHPKFFMFVLEMTFEAHLLTHNNDLHHKQSFTSYDDDSSNNTNSVVYEDLLSNGLNIIDRICQHDITKVDTLLSWGTYYKLLFERDRRYYEQLLIYIKSIVTNVLVHYKETFISSTSLSTTVIPVQQWNDCIYLFSLIFELSTFYKNINYTEQQQQPFTQKTQQHVGIPSYFMASCFFENASLNVLASIKTKWRDYMLIEHLFDIFESHIITKHIKDDDDVSTLLDNYILKHYKKNINTFIHEVSLLTSTTTTTLSNVHCCCNNGKPLIILLSNIYTLILSETTLTEVEFNTYITKYKRFLLFCVIAFTNMECCDSNNTSQRLMINVIYFGICFLSHKAISHKNNVDTLCNALRCILGACYAIYEKINNQIESNTTDKKNRLLSLFVSKTELPEQCAVFTFFDELKRKTSNTFMLELKQLSKADTLKVVSFISTNAMFKCNFTENAEKAEMIRKELFCFEDVVEARRNYAGSIIPFYDKEMMCKRNDISVDVTVFNRLVMSNCYIEECKYKEEVEEKVVKARRKVDDVIEVEKVKERFEMYQKKRKYKRIKKKLFAFRNVWSCEKLFYGGSCSGKLKTKLVNHLTKDFSRILLTPILDVDAYLPKFSEFDPKDLFYKQDNGDMPIVYKACDLSFWSYKQHNDANNSNSCITPSTPSTPFNILYYIYKETFHSNKPLTPPTSPQTTFTQFILQHTHTSPNANHREYIMECCILKQAYHIKGYLFNTSTCLHFFAFNHDKTSNLEEYDKDRQTCFGSIFQAQVPQMYYYYKCIPYTHIEMVLKRRYFFKRNSLEVFTLNKKSYFLKFVTDKDCETMYNAIQRHFDKYDDIQIEHKKIDKCIGYYNKKTYLTNPDYDYPYMSLSKKYEKWCEWEISTLELLMYLNIYANRSYNDMMQYPVAPWIIADYTSPQFDINNRNAYRELELPMGMMDLPSIEDSGYRKQTYITHYKTVKEEGEDVPYCYGSHYSNSLYTTHYLVRVFPFSYIKIELQGKTFDDPNRLFNHMDKSFLCAVTQKCDVRELIPEFFFFPEMFYNYNDLNLGRVKDSSSDEIIKLGDVDMPLWCGKNGYTFITTYRRALENAITSNDIHKWFDLIYGNKQRSEEKYNIFYEESYETYEEKFNKADNNLKGYSLRMLEFGVTPIQIFSANAMERKKENACAHRSKAFFENEDNLMSECIITLPKDERDVFSIYVYDTHNKNNFKVVLVSYLHVYVSLISKYQNQIKTETKRVDVNIPPHMKFICVDSNNSNAKSVAVYDNGNYIAIAGIYTGDIVIECLNVKMNRQRKVVSFPLKQRNVALALIEKVVVDDKETHALTLCVNGSVFIYRINKDDKMEWIYTQAIHDHVGAVNDIYISDRLNMFVTVGSDSYANVYTFPINIKLVNSLCLNSTTSNEGCCCCVDKCLISASPLPCFVFYYSGAKRIDTVAINGKIIGSKTFDYEVEQWKVFRNGCFEEFVMVCGRNEGNCVEVFALPDVKEKVFVMGFEKEIVDFQVGKEGGYVVVVEGGEEDEEGEVEMKVEVFRDKNKEYY